MKPVRSAFLLAGLLSGCGVKAVPDPKGWLIDAYDRGVVTVEHEGNAYNAECRGTIRNAAGGGVADPEMYLSNCDKIIDLVGHDLPPDGGHGRDATVFMFAEDGLLALRFQQDEQSPWIQVNFAVTNVKKNR
jgi:hypothetical protein